MSSPGLAPDGETVEEIPHQRSTLRIWGQLLAGPVLWIGHFMAVYLFGDAACAARAHEAIDVPGSGHIVPVVVAATVVFTALAVATTVWAASTARRGDGDDARIGFAGTLLGGLAVVAILAVGLPALALEPC